MKLKFFLLALFISVLFKNSYSQQDVNGWFWLNGKPTGNTLQWVKVFDAANIYAVGERGTFMKTTDGGDTWSINNQVGSPDNSETGNLQTRNLYTGWFFNANTGFVAGQSINSTPGYVSRTTDGGNTWNYIQYNNIGGTVKSMYFINSLTGYFTGTGTAKFYKTTDGGLSWVDRSNSPNIPVESFSSIHAVDTSNIFISCASNPTKKVYNYKPASGWTITTLPGVFSELSDIVFKDANTGYVCGNPNYFAYTTNGGSSWTQSNAPATVGQRDLVYSGGALYMAGSYTEIFKSTDNGVTWSSIYFFDNANLYQPANHHIGIIYAMSVAGNDIALVGLRGSVNISNDGGGTWRNKNYTVSNNNGAYLYTSILVQAGGTTGLPVSGNIWLGPNEGGNILFSSNAGANWTTKPTPNLHSVRVIQFVNANTGYICGGNSVQGVGEMSKTTNGGNTWTALSLPSPVNALRITAMNFVNANTGWAATEGGFCIRTINGGISWNLQTLETNTNYKVVSIQMLDANTGYAMASSLYKTTNGGTNWVKTTNPYILSGTWYNFYLMNRDIIYLNGGTGSGNSGKIVRSTDAGNTFTDLSSNLIETFNVIKTRWINMKHGIACGPGGITAKTTNGGESWDQTNTGGSTIVDISFPNKNEWYAVSDRNSAYEVWRKYENITSVSLNVTMGIEGFWNGSSMVTDLVTVELRNSTAPYAIVDQATEKVNFHGYATYEFPNAPTGSYYVVLKHRNSLETWSAVPVAMAAGGNYDYNFTTSEAQTFGNNTSLKSNVYCIFSGDINQDQTIDAGDLAMVENASGTDGYVPEDVTGDEYVDAADVALVENNKDIGIYVAQP
jgi:photosystem II stability/assembly factor-like uncharacterized protein